LLKIEHILAKRQGKDAKIKQKEHQQKNKFTKKLIFRTHHIINIKIMKSLQIILFSFLFINTAFSQEKYITKQGSISFFSDSTLEVIHGYNEQVLSVIDGNTQEIAILMLMKSFYFEVGLMQEHFNENYVESDKFPKATFKGKISNFDDVSGLDQTVVVEGALTIHGVTRKIKTDADLLLTKKGLLLKGHFDVAVSDYGIKIPALMINNIGKTVKITFELNHKR
jgi:hypothetical protein